MYNSAVSELYIIYSTTPDHSDVTMIQVYCAYAHTLCLQNRTFSHEGAADLVANPLDLILARPVDFLFPSRFVLLGSSLPCLFDFLLLARF